MKPSDLDSRFDEAVALATDMTQASLPQDMQLRLYACYKQATQGNVELNQTSSFHLRDAFKTNAWMQIKHLSVEDAKEQYISLIQSLIK